MVCCQDIVEARTTVGWNKTVSIRLERANIQTSSETKLRAVAAKDSTQMQDENVARCESWVLVIYPDGVISYLSAIILLAQSCLFTHT